jgi:MFS family permease
MQLKPTNCPYSGNEIGPFRAVEESTLAHINRHEALSDIFAWYSLIGTAGTALGMMACGWIISFLRESRGWDFVPACRVIFFVYAAVGIIKLILTLWLSPEVEAANKRKKQKKPEQQPEQPSETEPLLNSSAGEAESMKTPAKRIAFLPAVEMGLLSLILNLCLLFALDSFASGLASL